MMNTTQAHQFNPIITESADPLIEHENAAAQSRQTSRIGEGSYFDSSITASNVLNTEGVLDRDEDEEYESESGERSALVSSVLSCEKDEDEFNDEGNKDQWLPQSGRITINSGKDPLSKLQNGTLEETDIEGLIEDEEFSKSRGGITSLDGEYDDDSDEDNFFV